MPNPDRLTGLDASFLALEDAGAHMHVGSCILFDGEAPSYDEFAAQLDFEPYVIPLRQKTVTRATTLLYRDFVTRELPGLIGGRYRGQRISVPVRFLVGDLDPLYYPEMIEEQAPHFDDYQGESLSGVGHFIPEEVPDLLSERVLGFLRAPAATPL